MLNVKYLFMFNFPIDPTSLKSGRHDLAVTCIAIADNFKYFYTASKDCSIKKCERSMFGVVFDDFSQFTKFVKKIKKKRGRGYWPEIA